MSIVISKLVYSELSEIIMIAKLHKHGGKYIHTYTYTLHGMLPIFTFTVNKK